MDIMELPGGLLLDGQIRRDFQFKQVTGKLERAISESGYASQSLAEQVTGILADAMESIAGMPVNNEVIRALSSGDREYLILCLQSVINPAPQWLTLECKSCHEPVQFQLQSAMLPVKSAGQSFPQASLKLSLGNADIRVPTGADEEAIACGATNHQSALDLLLSRLLSFSNQEVDIDALTTGDQLLIDRMLDQMSPQPSQSVSISCPYCEHQQELPIDNYDWIIRQGRGLDEDIHTLAFYYHWSESNILSLPKMRRKQYIRLIERSLGKYQDVDHSHIMQGTSQ